MRYTGRDGLRLLNLNIPPPSRCIVHGLPVLGSARLVYVRFSQGDVFSELGEYARAILAYEEVIENYPQHVLSDAALGRIGDCQFALASEQPERYTEAKNAYLTLKDRMSASPELRLESLYKLGRCEEKMGFATEAFVQYMQGVYHYINAGLCPRRQI